MKPASRLLVAVLALSVTQGVSADVHMVVADDGTITLTDAPRDGRHERVMGANLGADALTGDARALPFAAVVAAAALEHGVPEALLHAVIRAESNYDPNAVSPKGAIGLMQLMPATARSLGIADARNPEANVRGGARYLKRLLTMFGDDVVLAVAAYNAGPGAILRSGRVIPPYTETRRYVPKVMAHFERLQAQAESASLSLLAGR